MDSEFQKCIKFVLYVAPSSKLLRFNLLQFKKPIFEKYKSYERLNSKDMNSVKLKSSVMLAIILNC